jgi:hypothetical protein
MNESIRDRVVRLIREMRNRTTERGATPQEAAAFAAKVAEWIEKYQIEEAELSGENAPSIEIVQERIETGKRVFNPGVTAIIGALSRGMSVKMIMARRKDLAVYDLVGTEIDCHFVRQISGQLVSELQIMARLEGAEHGYEKAGLIRWTNNYLDGAAGEIESRLVEDRRQRSEIKQIEHEQLSREAEGGLAVKTPTSTALVITGDHLAEKKLAAAEVEFERLYPHRTKSRSRGDWDGTANSRGREAGRAIGLRLSVGGAKP